MYPKDYNKDGRHERPVPQWAKIVAVFGLLSLFLSASTKYVLSRIEKVKVYGTVVSHHITNDKYGEPTYYTIIKTDDGRIMTKTGLNYYIIKEDGRILIDEYVFK